MQHIVERKPLVTLTCKQSNEVTTILGDLLWQANSNGLKYFSAEIAELPSLGSGKADEVSVFSSDWHSDFMLSAGKTHNILLGIVMRTVGYLTAVVGNVYYSLRAASHSFRNSA